MAASASGAAGRALRTSCDKREDLDSIKLVLKILRRRYAGSKRLLERSME
jgi:hypothetical protein